MKKVVGFVLLALFCIVLLYGCESGNNSEFLRIHIRADNNEHKHQAVKYEIKDKVIRYLTPFLAECENKQKAYLAVKNELNNIKELCCGVLLQKGFTYGCKVYMANEYFPLRSYNEFTFDSGYYDALIIELGKGEGDNWWCMVYPPLCFTQGDFTDNERITYKSKLLEIIEDFKKYLS